MTTRSYRGESEGEWMRWTTPEDMPAPAGSRQEQEYDLERDYDTFHRPVTVGPDVNAGIALVPAKLSCDEAHCGGESCRYQVCPCRCHLYGHAHILHQGQNVSHTKNSVGTFLGRCLLAATWVVAGLVCAVAFVIGGLVILGWASIAGGAYGSWRVIARRE